MGERRRGGVYSDAGQRIKTNSRHSRTGRTSKPLRKASPLTGQSEITYKPHRGQSLEFDIGELSTDAWHPIVDVGRRKRSSHGHGDHMKGEIDIEVLPMDVPVPSTIATTGTWRQRVKGGAHRPRTRGGRKRFQCHKRVKRGGYAWVATTRPQRNARTSEIHDGQRSTSPAWSVVVAVCPRCRQKSPE